MKLVLFPFYHFTFKWLTLKKKKMKNFEKDDSKAHRINFLQFFKLMNLLKSDIEQSVLFNLNLQKYSLLISLLILMLIKIDVLWNFLIFSI